MTPLIAAARENRTEMAEFLLSKGADVDARDDDGYTALFYAAYNFGSEDANGATIPMVKLFLVHGAKVNVIGKDGSTPLMWAAAKGEVDIIEMLMTAGADANTADANGKTALLRAIEGQAGP